MMLLRVSFTCPLNTLKPCNHTIKWVTHARLLGVTIDNKLTRPHHIFEVLIFCRPGLKIYSDTHFHQKLLTSESCKYFDFLKGISNNLELLSFQKINGLWGYLLKPQALASIKAWRVLEGG